MGASPSEEEEVVPLPVEKIRPNPNNPRTYFDEGELKEMAASIAEKGLLQPVIVRRILDPESAYMFELIMGEMRLRAHRDILKLPTIKAIVREVTDEDSVAQAVIENVQRSTMTFFDTMNGYAKLRGLYGEVGAVAAKSGKSDRIVQQYLRIHREIHSIESLRESDAKVPSVVEMFKKQCRKVDLSAGSDFAGIAPKIRAMYKSNRREFDRVVRWLAEDIKGNMPRIARKCGAKKENSSPATGTAAQEFLRESAKELVLHIKVAKGQPVPEDIVAGMRQSVDAFFGKIVSAGEGESQ